jgi:hypothetical protein
VIIDNRDHKVHVVGFWPCPETTLHTKQLIRQHYAALHWTYDVSIRILNDPEDIHFLPNITYIAVEQESKTSIPIADFVHPDKAVYVVGSSKYQHPSFWMNADHRVHIDVPHMNHPLYGDQAMAIILHDRYLKNANI